MESMRDRRNLANGQQVSIFFYRFTVMSCFQNPTRAAGAFEGQDTLNLVVAVNDF
jgi:hypothetical protein